MLEWNAANIVDTLAIAGLLLGAALYVSIRLIRTLFPALMPAAARAGLAEKGDGASCPNCGVADAQRRKTK